MDMKRGFLYSAAILFLLTGQLAAADKELLILPSTDPDRDNVILEIEKAGVPYEKDDFVVFTARHKARYVGIVFDFERFSEVHPFNVRTMTDEDGEVRDSVMYYVLKRPKNIRTISYRLIVDGLWTCDPNNPDRYFDEDIGVILSRFTFASDVPPVTEAADIIGGGIWADGGSAGNGKTAGVKFVLRDKAGQHIRIAGSFTNWDPWIYEMKETSPGLYEMSLPLPSGTYYYTYYVGMKSFIDRANPNRAYTKDGRTVSVITVQ